MLLTTLHFIVMHPARAKQESWAWPCVYEQNKPELRKEVLDHSNITEVVVHPLGSCRSGKLLHIEQKIKCSGYKLKSEILWKIFCFLLLAPASWVTGLGGEWLDEYTTIIQRSFAFTFYWNVAALAFGVVTDGQRCLAVAPGEGKQMV